jgi:hypothetical protein
MGPVPVHPREDPRHVRRNLVYRTVHGELIINIILGNQLLGIVYTGSLHLGSLHFRRNLVYRTIHGELIINVGPVRACACACRLCHRLGTFF